MQSTEKKTNLWPEPEPVKNDKIKLMDEAEQQILWRDVVFIMMMIVILAGIGANVLSGN